MRCTASPSAMPSPTASDSVCRLWLNPFFSHWVRMIIYRVGPKVPAYNLHKSRVGTKCPSYKVHESGLGPWGPDHFLCDLVVAPRATTILKNKYDRCSKKFCKKLKHFVPNLVTNGKMCSIILNGTSCSKEAL